MFAAAIWPATVFDVEPMFTVAPLRTRPLAATAAAGMTVPVVEARRLTVPPLITVPPV